MSIPIYQVDAFTSEAFGGNPAAVCLLPGARDEEWMQQIAQEMNLSETAFLHKEADGYALRWFTPVVEVNLCGHATLASAHILFETGMVQEDEKINFHTKSGILTAQIDRGAILLDFPARIPVPTDMPPGLSAALSVQPMDVVHHNNRLLLELGSEEQVRYCQPDFSKLSQIPLNGLIITAEAEDISPFDFVSRYFNPWIGINEDPVTGSAHTMLAPYWANRLGKTEFLAYQASQRGGVLDLELVDNRVHIGGLAVTIFQGELLV